MAGVAGAAGQPRILGGTRTTRGSRDRLLFSGVALLAALTVFGGFARTYYLKGLFDSPALSGFLHLHGLLFST